MYLTKTVTGGNGASVSHHVVVRVLHEFPSDFVQVSVSSWPSVQSRNDGYPEIWRWNHVIAFTDIPLENGFRQGVLDALVTQDPWQGAATNVDYPPE